MTNIVFASNNLVHWPLSVSSTTAGTFDSSRVPYSLYTTHLQSMASLPWAPVSGNVTWIHYRLWFDGSDSNNDSDDFMMIKVFDVTGNLLFEMTKVPTFEINNILDVKLYRDGGASTDGQQQFPFNLGKMNTFDVRYELTGSVIKLDLYVNGGLALELEYTGTAAFTQPVQMTIGSAFAIPGTKQHVSEIIVADGDTRNARLNLLRPTASGGETDWVGAALDLADNDPTSGMTSIAANERQTLDLSTYTGAGNISSLVVATVALAGVNAPQNMRHLIRISATNYESPADIALGQSLKLNLTDFQINPATSLPWVSGDLSSMEMGFISKA